MGVINILLAASFFLGAIYTFHATQRDNVKLGLILGYTTAFALCTTLMTNAKRSEISALVQHMLLLLLFL
jgi:hypothetical protein